MMTRILQSNFVLVLLPTQKQFVVQISKDALEILLKMRYVSEAVLCGKLERCAYSRLTKINWCIGTHRVASCTE